MKIKNLFNVVAIASTLAPVTYITACANTTGDIVSILYTNDVHCALNWESGLTYSNVKGFRNMLDAKGQSTLLVDSGDYISGGFYGSYNQGKYITQLMNVCNYDLCIPGNHEFDYGIARFYEFKDQELNMPMISSNFYHMKDGQYTQRVLDDTKVFNVGKKKIGFVGVSTPETLTTSNPKNFMDEHGNYIYGFKHESQQDFYSCIQKSIDSLTDQKCDAIIALSHLGELTDREFNSVDLVKNTSGLSAVLDGHSHTYNPGISVKDKDNKDVLITQTGTNLSHIGCLTIDARNNLSYSMINASNCHDDKVDQVLNTIKEETDPILKKEIGNLGIDLTTKDASGKRLVRKGETNLGDLAADSLKEFCTSAEVTPDFAIVIGGGIRQDINKGIVTNKEVLNVFPFSNELWMLKLKGSKIRDVLEWGVHKLDKVESSEWGGFLQISDGLSFEVNLQYDNPCIEDSKGFVKVDPDKPRRVTNIKIGNEALEDDKEYNMAGIAYTIRDLGDGYNMLKEGVTPIEMEQHLDYEALAKFLKEHMTDAGFNTKYGQSQERIKIIK